MKQRTGLSILSRLFDRPKTEPDITKSMALLIVDDEERFLYSMEKLLVKKGYRVQTAASGEQCLGVLEEKPVDVVILDIKMPGIDGLETLRRIKRRYPLVEVVLLTGHATVESAVEGLKSGAFDFLMKPISVSDLLDKVKEAYKRRRAAEEKIRDARCRRFLQQSSGDILRAAKRRTERGHDDE